MNSIIEQIKETIARHGLICSGDNIVLGFSGGPDSACLLHSLYTLREYFGINKIAAVHINHMYRGEDAFKDEAFAERFCKERGILFFLYRYDIEKLAKEFKMSSEEIGRKLRYEAFAEVAQKLGGAKIAVAHNREDQAETLLMRLVRGTGTDGLSGIDYTREGGIIRPLLNCSRSDIEGYCAENALKPRIDLTNLEPIYTRNVIRLKLIPYINNEMDADIVNSLANLSEIIKEDKDFIYSFVEEVVQKCRVEESRIVLEKNIIKELHPSVRKRVIMRCFRLSGLENDITSVHLNESERLMLSEKSTWNCEFPHGFIMKCRYDKIYFEKVHNSDTIDYKFIYRIIEEETELLRFKTTPVIKKSLSGQAFDLDKVENAGALTLRTRRPGDVISPRGFKGTKKLKEYFIDEKIDRDLRDTIPLLCVGSVVLWIFGYEVNEKFLPDKASKRLMLVNILHAGE